MKKIVFQGSLLQVSEELSTTSKKVFETVERPPGVRLIIPPPAGILLNYEHRPKLNVWDYRLPGGKVCDSWKEYEDNSKNFNKEQILKLAVDAAIKEGLEEQGLIIKKENLDFFCIAPCGTTVVWDLYYFVVTDYIQSFQKLEEEEQIERRVIPYDKIGNLCLSEYFTEDRSSMVLLKYLKKRDILFL